MAIEMPAFNPTTLNSVSHFAFTEAQMVPTSPTNVDADAVVDALASVVVDLTTGKTRLDEGYESGLVNLTLMASAGY